MMDKHNENEYANVERRSKDEGSQNLYLEMTTKEEGDNYENEDNYYSVPGIKSGKPKGRQFF